VKPLRVKTRGFTSGKCKAFSGQPPLAAGGEIGQKPISPFKNRKGYLLVNPHKNLAPFILVNGGAFGCGFCN
jgi:hypothetical protein